MKELAGRGREIVLTMHMDIHVNLLYQFMNKQLYKYPALRLNSQCYKPSTFIFQLKHFNTSKTLQKWDYITSQFS